MSIMNTNSRAHGPRRFSVWVAGVSVAAIVATVAVVTLITGTLAPSRAGGPAELSLLFQGSVHGKIDECGCKSRSLGGLAARAGIIDDVGRQAEHLVLVDAGNLFGTAGDQMRRQTRFLAQETADLGYRVAGVGPWDLNHGLAFLQDLDATTDLTFTSANLMRDGDLLLSPYEIVEAAGVRIGLISVCDDELPAPAADMLEGDVEVGAAIDAIARFLPEVSEQSDVVILLSNLKQGKTEALLRDLDDDGIHFAIEGYANVRYDKIRQVGSTTVLAANSQGKYLGQLDLMLADGLIHDTRLTLHAVDPKEHEREEMAERVRQFKDEVEELARR